jgi:type VI secretion system secreted protein Hcp
VNKFLKLEGMVQGLIKGSVTLPGKEDLISVISVSHEISHPIDPTTGTFTGKLVHKPLVLVKFIDRSTPRLYQALGSAETMKTFNLAFYVKTATGQEVQQFTIDLGNAKIASILQVKQNSDSTPDLMKFAEYEEVYFIYQTIQWSWKDGLNVITSKIAINPPV